MTTKFPPPPAADRRPVRIEQLGRVREDDYAWLKDENWQSVMRDPSALREDIARHLRSENAYTEAVMADTKGLQETLFMEMKGRIKEDDASVPKADGLFDYYSRYALGAQHPIFARRPRGGGAEEVLLDANALAAGKAFFHLAGAGHSPDHQMFAYAVDEQGSEYHEIHIKDLATGAPVGEPIRSAEGGFVFCASGEWIFWVHRDENARPSKVMRRRVAGEAAEEVVVYAEEDEGMFLHLDETRSRAFIVIGVGDHETSAAWLIPAHTPQAAPQAIEARRKGVMYSVEHWDERLIILTNADGAVDFKLMWAPLDAPQKAHWRPLAPYQPGRFILGVAPFSEYLVRIERVDANHKIVIRARSDGAEIELPIGEEACALSLDPGYEYDSAVLRFVYQSPTTPRSWYDYDMASGERLLRKTQQVPSGHNPDDYLCRRVYATAADGETIPITILSRRDAPLDRSAPLLLYGYGAYGISMDATFSVLSLSLVDRGWVWAVAHVRGGSEKGRGWFLDGRGRNKMKTFTDFIASAETLIAEGYAAAGNIVAFGGSAGGLLVGAAVNLRPDLWAGVVGAVPFVDALNTMSDASLPLTPPEWPEWGDPLTDPDAYDCIASYSPYDNVRPCAYPAILATGGLSDPRVTYWEPAKWVAKLRAATTSRRPVLLKINMTAGHQGSSGRFESLKEVAFEYAFAMKAVDPAFVVEG